MGFFDKVKGVASEAVSAVTDAANDVSKGAKEMSEKSKLNRAIRTEEGKISNLYAVIGKKFFEENASAPSGYEDQFAGINTAKSEIARLNDELSAIEATSKCPKCGNKVTPNQKFCQGCGCNLESYQKPAAPAPAAPAEPVVQPQVVETTADETNTENQQ